MDLKLVDSSDKGKHDGKCGDLKGASAVAGDFSHVASSGIGAGHNDSAGVTGGARHLAADAGNGGTHIAIGSGGGSVYANQTSQGRAVSHGTRDIRTCGARISRGRNGGDEGKGDEKAKHVEG
jgi:hypothetical protein